MNNDIVIKNNELFSPIVFFQEGLTNKKVHTFIAGKDKYVTAEDSYKIELNGLNTYTFHHARGNNVYVSFYGGLMDAKEYRILALVVRDAKGIKYGLVDKEFSLKNPTPFKRVKKSFTELGILIKTRLIVGDYVDITKTYLEILNPTIDDYKKEKQLAISKEFLEFINTPVNIETEEEEKAAIDDYPF